VPPSGDPDAFLSVVSCDDRPPSILEDGLFVLQIVGDEMSPTLEAGQFVLVDTGDVRPSPPGVFAMWENGGIILRRLQLLPGVAPRRVRVAADNEKYSEAEIPLSELRLKGRVVAFCRAI